MPHPYTRRLVIALALLASGLAPAHPARAAGVVGDGTTASCTEAAFAAALLGGGTITFNCGGSTTIVLTGEKLITQPTVIDGGGTITLSGGLNTRLLATEFGSGTPLTLRDLVLESAYSNNASGAAVRAFGPLTMTRVTVQNNVVDPFCGAVLVGGDALIENSVFQNNSAALGGAALCFRSAPTQTVTVRNTLFYNNVGADPTTGYGGALYVDLSSRVTVIDSVFLGNHAHFGGAAYVGADAALTLHGTGTGSIFTSALQLNGNRATEDGGALYNNGGTLAIDGALITANQTPTQTALAGYGGAVFNTGALTLARSHLSQNQGRYGGAVFVGGEGQGAAQATLDHVTFKLNTAGSLGGGLYTNNALTSVTITNTLFYLNTAPGGGGLARFNAGLRIVDSAFVQNTAVSGGGLSLSAGPAPTDGPYVHVESVTISGNTASSSQGGGLFNSGRAELYHVTVTGNSGGTYTVLGGNTRLRGAVLDNAGALNCDGDGTGQLSNDGGNHIGDNSCGPQIPVGAGDPRLGPLAIDARTGTYYHAPLSDSPLIGGGFNCPDHDQLGALRVGLCDIGAIEFGGLLPQVWLPTLSR